MARLHSADVLVVVRLILFSGRAGRVCALWAVTARQERDVTSKVGEDANTEWRRLRRVAGRHRPLCSWQPSCAL
ncbi:hypothetical protein C8Q77DRAFT_350713 [Trametes polyzona]|nr:hypothetical protein C8Q77DRAFT_350713 [Trametes polyzona]